MLNLRKSTPENYSIEDVKSFVGQDLKKIENLLQQVIKDSSQLTYDVSNSIFASGGKRIRPILTILSGKLFNYQSEELFYLAAAVELIHTATLLHDDVIDDSQMRRGKETANYKYGNKAPILVGDFLFAESFKYMVNSKSLDALKILAEASSIISEGEVKQLELIKHKDFTQTKYLEVIQAKTAELFGAATESAAILAGRSSSEAKILKEFGVTLGIAFQIIDDVLDYSTNASKLGKNLGDDFFEQKITLPVILLHKNSTKSEQIELEEIFHKTPPNRDDLNFVITQLANKEIPAQCYDFAKGYLHNSLKALHNFPANETRNVMEALCHIAIERKY